MTRSRIFLGEALVGDRPSIVDIHDVHGAVAKVLVAIKQAIEQRSANNITGSAAAGKAMSAVYHMGMST